MYAAKLLPWMLGGLALLCVVSTTGTASSPESNRHRVMRNKDDRTWLRQIYKKSFVSKSDDIKNVDLLHERDKRFVFTLAAVAAVAPIASAVFSGGSFIYGIVNGQQKLAELKEINARLKRLEGKVDEIATRVQSLQHGQQWLEGAILYGDDVQRLNFLLDYLVDSLHLDESGTLQPRTAAVEWAANVLSLEPTGAAQVLNNFHDMIMGTSGLFGTNSLVDIYKNRLDARSMTYWADIKSFVEYIISLETGGYAAWMTALNIAGRQHEVQSTYNRAIERLEQQARFVSPLTSELEGGRYTIRSQWGCPSNGLCNAQLSWDGANPHAIATVETNDPVVWELRPQGGRLYVIRNTWGCPSHALCNAELSWDGHGSSHPTATVEFGDRVLWEISPRGSGYVVHSKWGCPGYDYCNGELSWDGYGGYARATVEKDDPVDWSFTKL